MKTAQFSTLTLFFLGMLLFVPNIYAQNYTKWSLPESAKARLGKGNLTGKLAYSSDGNLLAVASSIGIWIYDADTGATLNLLAAPAPVSNVVFSPDGKTIASGSWDDDIVRLWDVSTGQLLATLTGHTYGTYSVAFSPDGAMLTSGGGDLAVRLWDVGTRQLKTTFIGHSGHINSVTFSPDGSMLAGGSDDNVWLWDVTTGQSVAILEHKEGARDVAFSPDGTTLASASWDSDSTVTLWDTATWQPKISLGGHNSLVASIAFSPNGSTLATGGSWRSSTVRLWDVDTGQLTVTLGGQAEFISSVAFSPDGATLASASWDNTVWLRDTSTLKPRIILKEYTDGITSIAFSPDGTMLATGGGWPNHRVRLWDMNTGKRKAIFGGHPDGVSSIAFSPDNRTLAIVGYDSTGGDSRYNRIRLWDANTGQFKTTLLGHTDSILSVAFSPDGKTLATGGGRQGNNVGSWEQDKKVRLWDMNTGQLKAIITGLTDSVRSLAFSPEGNILATGSRDRNFQLWNVNTQQLIATLRGDRNPVNSIAFSPDGKKLAVGSGHGNWGTEGLVQLWDVATRELIATLTGDGNPVNSVAFSPNGRTLATGHGDWKTDGIVQLWDVTTQELIATFTAHTEDVSSIAFSPDGTTLASGSEDGTVLLWNVTPLTDTSPPVSAYDINRDGIVNLLDLVTVADTYGQAGERLLGDVNNDGFVNILDLVTVSAHLDETTASAAPIAQRERRSFPAIPMGVRITPETVQKWIDIAHTADDGSLTYRRGLANLNALLAMLTPTETVLLPNFPNPFNPETWIPYRLVHPADVTLTIYDTEGAPVRRLDLGHQSAGYYTDHATAAYWDRRAETGEPVASGVYFYSLSAGDYSATRKMLILK